jgi:hypothetical protein
MRIYLHNTLSNRMITNYENNKLHFENFYRCVTSEKNVLKINFLLLYYIIMYTHTYLLLGKFSKII